MDSHVKHAFVIGSLSLMLCTLLGAGGMAVLEGVRFIDGLWLSFSVVSTTGFEPPTSSGGRLLSLGLYSWALASYVTLLTGVVARARLVAAHATARLPKPPVAEDDIRRVVASMTMN